MRQSSVWLFLVPLSFGVLRPSEAEACSFPDSVHGHLIQPADASTGVPLNSEIRIEYRGPVGEALQSDLTDIVVRPAGGEAIGLAVELRLAEGRGVVVARPEQALLPNTSYEILDRWTEGPCDDDVACFAEEPSLAGTFTTGDAVDSTPPTFAGLTDVNEGREVCDQSACCGPFDAVSYAFAWDPATDDAQTGEIRYDLLGPGGVVVQPLLAVPSVYQRGYQVCSGQLLPNDEDGHFRAPPGIYAVHAVDLAGNEDANQAVFEVGQGCVDDPDGDADADGDGDAPAASEGGACSAAGHPGVGGSLVPLLVLLGSLLVRRRAPVASAARP